MSISSISNTSGVSIAQLLGVSSTPGTISSVTDPASTPPVGGPSRFASALQDAFASIGVPLDSTGNAASTSSSTATPGTDASTSNAGDAVASFLQNLFAALHSQSAGAATTPTTTTSAATTSATAAATASAADPSSSATPPPAVDQTGQPAAHHGHHGHHGKLEGDLQSLISQLTASSSSSTDPSTTADAATGSTTTATTGSTTLTDLEKSYDAVLAQSGVASSSGDSLTTFLQALAGNLHGAPATGNVVTAQA